MSFDGINLIYSANMTGASVSMIHPVDVIDKDHFTALVENEGITDLILAIDVTEPRVLRRILDSRKKLSLNNVIVYRYGLDTGGSHTHAQRRKDNRYMALRRMNGSEALIK